MAPPWSLRELNACVLGRSVNRFPHSNHIVKVQHANDDVPWGINSNQCSLTVRGGTRRISKYRNQSGSLFRDFLSTWFRPLLWGRGTYVRIWLCFWFLLSPFPISSFQLPPPSNQATSLNITLHTLLTLKFFTITTQWWCSWVVWLRKHSSVIWLRDRRMSPCSLPTKHSQIYHICDVCNIEFPKVLFDSQTSKKSRL